MFVYNSWTTVKAENLEKCFSLNFWKNVKHQNHYADGDLTIWISLKINTFVAELADLIRVSTKKILMKTSLNMSKLQSVTQISQYSKLIIEKSKLSDPDRIF